MQDLVAALQTYPPFGELERRMAGGGSVFVEGLWGSSAAFLMASLALHARRTILCILPQIEHAEAFAEDVALFAPDLPLYFPAWEGLDADEPPDAEIRSQRLAVLKYLAAQRQAARTEDCRLIAAPVQAALQHVPSPSVLGEHTLLLRKGMAISPTAVADWLAQRNFQPMRQAEVPGEFSRRGGILDVFPYAAEAPVRIEFTGDEIESLRTYDPATQSSLREISELTVAALPAQAERADRSERAACIFDHLPGDVWVMLKEPAQVMERAGVFASDPGFGVASRALEALRAVERRFATLWVAGLPGAFGGQPIAFHVHSVERFSQETSETIRELRTAISENRRVIILCANDGERQRLAEMLAGSPLLTDPRFEVRLGRLNQGFDWSDLSLTVLTHHEIFRRYRQRRSPARYRHLKPVDSFYELQRGDLVVHAVHGIGRFHGMEVIEREGERQECLKIEYADRAFLYVPASCIEHVQKYVGPSERQPPLNKLGTRSWLLRKQRAQEAVRSLAAELLRLQAIREATEGIAHPPDNDWQREFEAAFPYEETEDQLTVAEEVKRDMESHRPMDRLICGDVGYGKTEVAMRAAFKAVMGGAQVAVLVPTTVLAAQHFQTFSERMADYPLRVEMLSRFVPPAEQERILQELAGGSVDIVIGTHRLIQPDVAFANLGLVIIDEEQRFGVEHKERLKRLRETVDVLTLTATPIPRTLHMSLLGIRDISTLETPPRDRLAIHTRLIRYDPSKIRQAILHELSRDGQVFFVHNRVETIERMAQELRQIVPEARMAVGHGQMPERALAEVMRDFVEHRFDVLVCTTIIESGLDIPNVNTILINNADMFGLAELHQLRGRVGRYKHRAYAYLLLPKDRPITPTAEKRLKAIEEFCELGAGFKIATKDLEIRGAGNILGPEQSGHLAAVGYDMYCRLLEQEVRALKNMPVEERVEVSLSLGTAALIPQSYVADPVQRIELYRRLQRAQDAKAIETLRSEMRDRFGPLPPEAETLLAEARLRQLAQKAGIAALMLRDGKLIVQPHDLDRAVEVISASGLECRWVDDRTLHVPIRAARFSGVHLVSFLSGILEKGLRKAHSDQVRRNCAT